MGIGILDKWWYEYRMWEMMMAGTTSSRLYRELRQSLGWGYYVHLAGENLADGGVWAIQTGVARENEKKVIEVIGREVRKSIDEGVREEELEAVRKNWRGRMSLAMDDSEMWAKVVSSGLLERGELTNLQLEMEKYEKVKLRKINEIMKTQHKDGYGLRVEVARGGCAGSTRRSRTGRAWRARTRRRPWSNPPGSRTTRRRSGRSRTSGTTSP